MPQVVVVLPYRQALESADPRAPARAVRDHVLAAAAHAGVPALDAWDLFAEVVRRDGSGPYFARTVSWDVHFSAEGHALLARFLDARLEAAAGLRLPREARSQSR